MTTIADLKHIIAANKKAGGHFFDEGNMKADRERGAEYYLEGNLLTITYADGHRCAWLFEPSTGRMRPFVDGQVEYSQ